MKRQHKLSSPYRDRRARARPQYCWRIGDASVSIEELQAWQLGPAHEAARLDSRRRIQGRIQQRPGVARLEGASVDYACEQCGRSGALCVSDWGYIAALCEGCMRDRKNYLKLPCSEQVEGSMPPSEAAAAV
jgi:hypothetical protein